MVLSLRHRFLFVHIAKTAGSSLRRSLRRIQRRDPWYVLQFAASRLSHVSGHRIASKLPRHARIIAAKEMLPEPFFDSLFKFSFVRNPWDRYVSAYHHIMREQRHLLKGDESFEGFLRLVFDPERPWQYHLDTFSTVEWSYLVDLEGRCCVDFIGRYERLEEDYEEIFKRIGVIAPGLAHERMSSGRKDYRAYYSDEMAEWVATRHRADLEHLAYTFDPE